MKDENKVITFGSLEIPAEDIHYYEIYCIIAGDILNHYENTLRNWKTKRLNYKEFYEILKKSGYINFDSAEFDRIMQEICPMPPMPDYDKPLHCLYVSTPYEIYEFWEGETDFDIFKKLNELDTLLKI